MFELPVTIEIPIIFTCNLTCRQCAHLSPYFPKETPPMPIEQIEKTCADWSNKITARHAVIMGGEPLLHPDIEQICRIFRRYWNHTAQIEVVTNGLLLDRMPPSFFETLAEYQIHCKITLHHKKFEKQINRNVQLLKSSFWIHNYTKDGDHLEKYHLRDGTPELFRSHAQDAYHLCFVKGMCTTLYENKLHHCSCLCYMQKAHALGVIDDARVLNYKAATPDMTEEQLREWWTSDFHSVCEVCPKRWVPVSSEEKFK
jgi:organic radical activating enzyme